MINPILIDLPHQIESDRLLIRLPLPEDALQINEAVIESLEELNPWMIWAQKAPTLEESKTLARQSHIDFLARKDLQLLVFEKESGRLVASSGLHRIDWDVRKFEIGYWVRTSESKKGYITEAVNAITNFAIEQLDANRIEIRCDSTNTNSANVAKRCGFVLDGLLRHDSKTISGELRSTYVFSKVKGIDY